MQINVIDAQDDDEQIYHVNADAMLMAIGPTGKWDSSISKKLEEIMANRLASSLPFGTGQAVLVDGPTYLATGFRRFIFIGDDGKISVAELVSAGLNVADNASMRHVTLPLLRSTDAWPILVAAILVFASLGPKSLEKISIVVNGDVETAHAIQAAIDRTASVELS